MAIAMPTLLQANMLSRLMNLRNAEILLASRHIATGWRVASAADDPSGLARIRQMESQVRGLNQAARNIQQGISLLQAADGGAEQIQSTITDIQTLVTQAGDATLSTNDLNAIQTQVNTLLASIDTIAGATQFNGLDLLNGTSSPGSGAQMVSFTDTRIDGATAASVTTGDYNMTVSTLPQRALVVGSSINSGSISAGTLTVNGNAITYATGTPSAIATELDSKLEQYGISILLIDQGQTKYADDGTAYSPNPGKVRFFLQSDSYGSSASITVSANADLGFSATGPITGTDINGTFSGAGSLPTITRSGLTLTGTNGAASLAVTVKGADHGASLGYPAGTVLGPLTVSSASSGGVSTFSIQSGANAGETTTLTTYNLTAAYLGLSSIDVTSSSGRTAAATALSAAAALVGNARASIGADEQGLQSLLTNVQNEVTNVSAAQSNLRDVDAAAEMTRLVTLQILQNASAALLSQAGSSSQQVFQVLFAGSLAR